MTYLDDEKSIDQTMAGITAIELITQTGEEEVITKKEYGTTWVAWPQLLSIVLINGSCSLMWMSACSSPIAVSQWLNVNLTLLNWFSNASAIINSIFSLVTGWSYERYGIKANVMIPRY